MTDDFQQKLDAYIKEHYDPNGDAESDYALAWAKAFGEHKYLTEDKDKKKGVTAAGISHPITGVLASIALPSNILDKLLAQKAETFSEMKPLSGITRNCEPKKPEK